MLYGLFIWHAQNRENLVRILIYVIWTLQKIIIIKSCTCFVHLTPRLWDICTLVLIKSFYIVFDNVIICVFSCTILAIKWINCLLVTSCYIKHNFIPQSRLRHKMITLSNFVYPSIRVLMGFQILGPMAECSLSLSLSEYCMAECFVLPCLVLLPFNYKG